MTATIEGLASGDLSGLNTAVEDSVSSLLDSVGEKLSKIGDIPTNGNPRPMSTTQTAYSEGEATRARQEKIRKEQEALRTRQRAQREREIQRKKQIARAKAEKKGTTALSVPFKPVGDVSSVLYMAGGGIVAAIGGVEFLSWLIEFAFGSASFFGAMVSAGVMAVAAGIINIGIFQRKRIKLARRFAQLCGNKNYIGIDELANAVNKSPRKTLSEIKKMLNKGFFPQGHIDAQKTTLMLSDSVYDEYVRCERQRAIDVNADIIDTTARVVTDDETSGMSDQKSELEQMIAEGNGYIEKLHVLNDEIPGEVISEKLDRLEILLKEIFGCVKKHPEQMSRMHEVMSYYLPTILKLVEAYKEYDGVTEPDEEMIDAKNQIEGSIDTINGALKKILSNLFRDSVWDVTTDAQVLNTMLAQKGLTEE